MAKRANQPKLELSAIIGGIEETLLLCAAATALISGNSNSIDSPSGSDQLRPIARRYLALDTCRLFDPEHPDYPTRSIPAALNYLRFHADYLEIGNRPAIIQKLVGFGHEPKEFEGIPDPWVTQLLRQEFADRLPRELHPDSSDLSAALHTLRSLCDTFPLNPSAQAAIERAAGPLLVYAADFVNTLRQGYL